MTARGRSLPPQGPGFSGVVGCFVDGVDPPTGPDAAEEQHRVAGGPLCQELFLGEGRGGLLEM